MDKAILTLLGSVDSEGGPLLAVDTGVIKSWHGAEGEALDYRRACAVFEAGAVQGGTMEVSGEAALIWDMGGPGTADVFRVGPDTVILLRVWPAGDEAGTDFLYELARLPIAEQHDLGHIGVRSDRGLTILWSAESGNDEDESFYETGVTVDMPQGRYRCFHDAVEGKGAEAIRCHIVPENP